MPDFGRWTSNGGDPSLNEINRTDRFLDSLAHQQPVYATDPGEAELANLLAGWRDEVRDTPLTRALNPRDAVVAFDSARASRKRGRTLAVVGSAAAAVLCLGGFASVVAGAGPGDSLYGLRTMIFGEQQAPRDDAVMLASQQLAEVQQLIDQGQWEAAQDKLQTLTTTVATVDDVEQQQELVSQWQELTVKVEQQDANATVPPGAPLPQMPDVPLVVAPGADTSTSSSDAATSTPSTPPSDTTTASTTPSDTPSTSATSQPGTATTTTSAPGQTSTTATSAPGSPGTTATSSAPPVQLPAVTTTSAVQLPQTRAQTVAPSTPLPTPSAPLPTPSAPLPTPTSRIVLTTPQPAPSVAAPPAEEPAAQEKPAQEEPKSPVTTTVVIPEPDSGEGSN